MAPGIRNSASAAWRHLMVAAGLALVASCASSVEVGEPAALENELAIDAATPEATTTDTTATDTTTGGAAVSTTQCRNEGSFRARLVEIDPASGEVLTETRYEVSDEHVRSESAGAERGQVILDGTEAWSFSPAGWLQLPVVPVRPLRTPWVNNFVTGEAVARAATDTETETVYGFETQRVELTFDQFQAAFPGKSRDIDYDADATSFTYWLDVCQDIVKAEITTTFGPETADLLSDDFPLTLNYSYQTYDIGLDYPSVTPEEDIIAIPPPPG